MEIGVHMLAYELIFSYSEYVIIQVRGSNVAKICGLRSSLDSITFFLKDFTHATCFRNSSPLLTTRKAFTCHFIASYQKKRAGNLRKANHTLKINKHARGRRVVALAQLERN